MAELLPGDPHNAIFGLFSEITNCRGGGAVAASAIMVYISIDVMAYLSLPEGRDTQTGKDFIRWVDTYMKADPQSSYQYDGRDLYGARCAMVHGFSTEGSYQTKNAGVKQLGYHDGGQHAYDPGANAGLVIIGIESLIHDFMIAVGSFLEAAVKDAEFRGRLSKRLPKVVQMFPIKWDGEVVKPTS